VVNAMHLCLVESPQIKNRGVGMSWILSIMLSLLGTGLIGIVIYFVLKMLKPSVIVGHRRCAGGWWEAELNNCSSGLIKIPQQPINTYSNIAYAAAGFALIFMVDTLPAYTIGLACIYLCVSSSLFHAISTSWAERLDVSAVYGLFSAIAVYAVLAIIGFEGSLVALLMVSAAGLSGYLLCYQFQGKLYFEITICLLITYGFAFWGSLESNRPEIAVFVIISVLLFAFAFLAWILDRLRKFPFPRWGHGLWHLMTAGAINTLSYSIHLIDKT